jgi:putative ABC transport system ATP-binding protein
MLHGMGLTFHFGQSLALDGVDITIADGELVAVMGPSGCGKSTLLNVLAGILRPATGEVRLRDERLDHLGDGARSARRLREFGFVLQFGDLVPELTLRENVELPLRLLGERRRSVRSRASDLMVQLEIAGAADRVPAEVSGGEAQRAAVARALVHRPAVIFADEPTGALDSVAGERVLDALTGLARRHGSAVVLVTHDGKVAAHADRMLFMRDGRLVT